MGYLNELKLKLRNLEITQLENLGLSRKDAEFAIDGIDCDIKLSDILECINYNDDIKRFLIEKQIRKKKECLNYIIAKKKHQEEIKDILSQINEAIEKNIFN